VKEERTTLGQVEIKVEEGKKGLGDEGMKTPSLHHSGRNGTLLCHCEPRRGVAISFWTQARGRLRPWQSDALDCCGFRHLPRAERYARNDREVVGQTVRFAKARLLYLPDTMPVTGL